MFFIKVQKQSCILREYVIRSETILVALCPGKALCIFTITPSDDSLSKANIIYTDGLREKHLHETTVFKNSFLKKKSQ